MAKTVAKKIIQLPIESGLLVRIDETATALATSRTAFIHEACRLRVQSLATKNLDRRYAAGYRKIPEKTQWAETGAILLSQILPAEDW